MGLRAARRHALHSALRTLDLRIFLRLLDLHAARLRIYITEAKTQHARPGKRLQARARDSWLCPSEGVRAAALPIALLLQVW